MPHLCQFSDRRIFLDANIFLLSLRNLTILEVTNSIFRQSHVLINKYQLLSSDAVHVATCLANNIKHVATNDNDFKRVRALTIWSP